MNTKLHLLARHEARHDARPNRHWRLSALAAAALLGGCAITPAPIPVADALNSGQADQSELKQATVAPQQRISLEEAMARAMLHNRDRRVQMMEAAVASRQLDMAPYDRLPQLTVNAGYVERDRLAASSSGVLENGNITRLVPPTYSVSADRRSETNSLVLNWNLLDFGLSYWRAGQAADRVLIARERERKAVHNLIQDVRAAYWRALSAQRLLKQTLDLRARVQQALADSRRVEAMRLKNPMEALSYQRDLLDIRRSLEALQKELLDARTQLATLMGLPPSTGFELVEVAEQDYRVPQLRADVQTLERTALALRPELMEQRYQKRITESEGRTALLGLIPGLNLSAGVFRDTNDFLLYNNWNNFTATLGVNLFNALRAPQLKALTKAQNTLVEERRLALTAAVLGQVHLSLAALGNSREQYETASDYLDVVRKIRQQVSQMRTAERSGELDLIREEMAELLASLRKDVAYAELQNSYGRVFVTAGIDPSPKADAQPDIAGMAKAMRERMSAWERGEVGLVLKPLSEQAKPWRGPGEHQLKMDPQTFSLAGDIRISARTADGGALPSWLKFDPQTQTFSGNPPAGQDSYAIEVDAVDAAGGSVRERFVLELQEVNDQPQGGARKTLAAVEGTRVLNGKLDAVDPDGDPLTFTLSGRGELPPGFSLEADGTWQFDPRHESWRRLKAGAVRETTLQFTATDPHGGRGTLDLVVQVTGVNNPPTATAPAEVRVSADSAAVQGRVNATDPDDDAVLTFNILGDKRPDGFTLEGDGRWSFDPQHPAYSTLKKGEFRTLFVPVRISDEMGGLTLIRLQITVEGAQP